MRGDRAAVDRGGGGDALRLDVGDQLIADIKAQGVAAATAINGGTIPAHIRFAGTSARPPWNLDWKIERRFNRDRFDADHPGVYESYRDAKGGWVLGPPR